MDRAPQPSIVRQGTMTIPIVTFISLCVSIVIALSGLIVAWCSFRQTKYLKVDALRKKAEDDQKEFQRRVMAVIQEKGESSK